MGVARGVSEFATLIIRGGSEQGVWTFGTVAEEILQDLNILNL